MRVTGVVQAGGKSARMGGRPKALLELGGRRIIERVVDAVKPAVDDLLIVTNTPALYAFLGLPLVAGRLRIVVFFDDARVVESAAREVARYRDPGIVFMNVNTPAELRQARAIAARLA